MNNQIDCDTLYNVYVHSPFVILNEDGDILEQCHSKEVAETLKDEYEKEYKRWDLTDNFVIKQIR